MSRIEYQVVNLNDIEDLGKKTVNPEVLKEAGLIRRLNAPVKLLGNGTIKVSSNITVDKASSSAIKAVEEAGGKVIVTAKPKPEKVKKVKKAKK